MKNLIGKILPAEIRNRLREWKKYFKSFLYFGLKYQCPFCKGHFRKLLPWGKDLPFLSDIIGAGRRNVMCPRCYSTDRERLIFFFLKLETGIFKKKGTLLHVSPEKNLYEIFIKNSEIEYTTVGLGQKRIMKQMDITGMDFQDEIFDYIICNHVLEHIVEDQKAISELFRVLKPGGWSILQVPLSKKLKVTYEDDSIVSPDEREQAFGQKDHVRIYAIEDYLKRLESVGFQCRLIDFAQKYGDKYVKKYALNPEEKIVFCKKPINTE